MNEKSKSLDWKKKKKILHLPISNKNISQRCDKANGKGRTKI